MWEWFERHWPWIGLVGALVLLAGLFGSNVFRQRRDVSRWRDPVWLSWLMVVAYLLHNFEEYGIDAKGRACCSRRGLLLFLPWIASRIWQPRPAEPATARV
jgi:hypothetical protein